MLFKKIYLFLKRFDSGWMENMCLILVNSMKGLIRFYLILLLNLQQRLSIYTNKIDKIFSEITELKM